MSIPLLSRVSDEHSSPQHRQCIYSGPPQWGEGEEEGEGGGSYFYVLNRVEKVWITVWHIPNSPEPVVCVLYTEHGVYCHAWLDCHTLHFPLGYILHLRVC